MADICDADLAYLTPGKKVAIKSCREVANTSLHSSPEDGYRQLLNRLVGRKGRVVKAPASDGRVLITFDDDLDLLGISGHSENALWVLVTDIKFVCRY